MPLARRRHVGPNRAYNVIVFLLLSFLRHIVSMFLRLEARLKAGECETSIYPARIANLLSPVGLLVSRRGLNILEVP